MSIGTKIKNLRRIKNISQEELATRIGAYITSISKYERDIQIPSADVIKKLAELFEVSADYLLFDDVNNIACAKIEDITLLKYFEKAEKLSQEDKNVIIKLIDALVFRNEVTKISEQTSHKSATENDSTTEPQKQKRLI